MHSRAVYLLLLVLVITSVTGEGVGGWFDANAVYIMLKMATLTDPVRTLHRDIILQQEPYVQQAIQQADYTRTKLRGPEFAQRGEKCVNALVQNVLTMMTAAGKSFGDCIIDTDDYMVTLVFNQTKNGSEDYSRVDLLRSFKDLNIINDGFKIREVMTERVLAPAGQVPTFSADQVQYQLVESFNGCMTVALKMLQDELANTKDPLETFCP